MSKESFVRFSKDLERFITKLFRELLDTLVAEEEVINNPPLDFTGKGSQRKTEDWKLERQLTFKWVRPQCQYDIIQYAVLSWYLPFRYQFEVQESLGDMCQKNMNYFNLQIYLESKEFMLKALFLETIVTKRALFGNILTGYIQKERYIGKDGRYHRGQKKLRVSLSWILPRKSIPSKRKRGYNDHGSLAPKDLRILREELRNLASLESLEYEQKRQRIRIEYLYLKYNLSLKGEGP